MSLERLAVSVKHEPGLDSQSESTESPLFYCHVVKEELDVGPELFQPPDVVYAQQDMIKKEQEDTHAETSVRACTVILEPMPMELKTRMCTVGLRTYQICNQDQDVQSTPTLDEIKEEYKVKKEVKTEEEEISHQHLMSPNTNIRETSSDSSLNLDLKKPVKCSKCSKEFNNPSRLRFHIRTHEPKKAKQKLIISNNPIEFSKRRLQLVEKPSKCNKCSPEFATSIHFRDHLGPSVIEIPFKCNQCSSVFAISSDLQDHLRTHIVKKPFMCKECGSGFATSSEVRDHDKIHVAEKPFKCGKCRWAFSDGSNLKVHLRTHQFRSLKQRFWAKQGKFSEI